MHVCFTGALLVDLQSSFSGRPVEWSFNLRIVYCTVFRDMTTGKISCDLCDGGQNLPSPVGDRVRVSENLGATAFVPVAPVDTYIPGTYLGLLSTFSPL